MLQPLACPTTIWTRYRFFPVSNRFDVIAGLLTKPYVTVHHGFDLNYLPARTRKTDYSLDEEYFDEQWQRIVSLIRKEGVEVIQLGIVEEEKIEGVTHCLNGLTTLEETGLLIKHGLCHIDTEGGLVHLANAVHGRCVVLFGPTPAEFFGYPENINLEPSGCKACWFVTQDLAHRVSAAYERAGMHEGALPDRRGGRREKDHRGVGKALRQADRGGDPILAEPLAETVAKARTLLGHDAANRVFRVLLILDDPPSEVGSELPDGVLDGSDVIVCAEQTAGLGAQ